MEAPEDPQEKIFVKAIQNWFTGLTIQQMAIFENVAIEDDTLIAQFNNRTFEQLERAVPEPYTVPIKSYSSKELNRIINDAKRYLVDEEIVESGPSTSQFDPLDGTLGGS